MKKFIFYYLAASVLLLTSCEKPDISSDFNISWSDFNWGGGFGVGYTVNGSGFDTSAVKYFEIPSNRYFHYKDVASGRIDTVAVTQSVSLITFVPATQGYPIGYNYSTYYLKFRNFSDPANQDWFKGTATTDFPSGNGSTPTWIYDSNFSLSNEETGLPAFWYPFASSGLNQYTYIPTITIEGKTYTEVHSFFSSNGLLSTNINYKASEFYWVKGIGIIKKEIRTYNSVKTSLLLRYG